MSVVFRSRASDLCSITFLELKMRLFVDIEGLITGPNTQHNTGRHDLQRSEKKREIRDEIMKEQKKKTFVITERSLDLDERKRAIW